MGPTTTNGVAVIAAGKKRPEQNHALPDREFGGDQFWLAVKLCLSPFPAALLGGASLR